MIYGIDIINNSNTILIDQDYSNYAVHSSGSLSSSGTSSDIFLATVYNFSMFVPNIAGAIVFIAPIGTISPGWYTKISGGYPGQNLVIGSNVAANILYIILTPPMGSYDYSMGMNIYKSDGSTVFSSNLSYLSLVTVGSVNANIGADIILPTSTKKSYININNCGPSGHVSASDGTFTYSGYFYLNITFIDTTINIWPNDYEYIQSISGSLSGGWSSNGDIRNFLVLEI